MPPIYQTTTYAQTSPGHPMGNMNTVELQTHTNSFRKCIGSIENGARGLAFSIWVSGNRLFDAGLKPGDEVIAMDDLYGGLYRLFTI
jgi:cystathionine beta-lyase